MYSHLKRNMGLLETIEKVGKLLNERASAAVLRERLAHLRDEAQAMEKQLSGLQRDNAVFASRIRELERKVSDYEQWDRVASRYQLRQLADGIFVYALTKTDGEPEHYLCPHCFGERKRSILQRPSVDHTNFVCHVCKLDIRPVATPFPKIVPPRFRPRMLDG